MIAGVLAVPPVEASAADTATPAPAPSCTNEQDVESAATAMAARCGSPVLIAAETSETSQSWALPNGQIRVELSSAPVRARKNNKWVPIDLTLVRQPDGSVAPVAHPNELRLSGATEDVGLHALATLESEGSDVAMGFEGELPEPELSGSKATYRNIKPNIDLVVEATPKGVESFYIVKKRSAASQVAKLTMPITAEDAVSHELDKDGGLALLDSNEQVVAASPQPLMWDARTDKVTGEPAVKRRVGISARHRNASRTTGRPTPIESSGVDLALTPDTNFLTDPNTVYPVTIDPALSATNGDTYDTWVRDGLTADQTTTPYLQIGAWSGKVARAYLNWNTSAFKGKYITSASLSLWNSASNSCTSKIWEAWTVIGGANTSTRWTNQPEWRYKDDASSATKSGLNGCIAGGRVYMNDLAGFFQRSADAGYDVSHMGLRASNEADPAAAKNFYSTDYTDTTKLPQVTVTYNNKPTVGAVSTNPAMACTTGTARPYIATTTPTLKAVVSDDDSYVGARFEWWTGGVKAGETSTNLVSVSGSTISSTVPAGQLVDGKTYSWRAYGLAADGGVSAAPSSWCEFTVDTLAPDKAPTVSSTAYPQGAVGATAGTAGTFSFGANGVSDVAAYQYGLDTNPPATVVNASSIGGAASVALTPPTGGLHTLYVRSRDRVGNLSPVNAYSFTAVGLIPTLASRGVYVKADGTQPNSSCVSGASRPVVNTLTPLLFATYSHPTISTINASFEYATVDGLPLGMESSGDVAGLRAAVVIPQDTLTSGDSYKWRVKAAGETVWSSWCEFTVRANMASVDMPVTSDDSAPTLGDIKFVEPSDVADVPGAEPVSQDGDVLPTAVNDSLTNDEGDEVDLDEPEEPVASISAVDDDPAIIVQPETTTPVDGVDECAQKTPPADGSAWACATLPTAQDIAESDAIDTERLAATQDGEVSIQSSYNTSPRICWGSGGVWRINRYEACYKNIIPVNTWLGKTLVGGFTVSVYRYAALNPVKAQWEYRMYFETTAAWGNTLAAITSLTGTWCDNSCRTHFYPQSGSVFYKGAKARLNVDVDALHLESNVGRPRYTMHANMTFVFISPVVPNVQFGIHTFGSNWVRCDNATRTGTSRGCVVPNYIPTLDYPLNGSRPSLAWHIREAQRSGLPGKPTCGKVQNGSCSSYNALFRMYDQARKKLNRDRACPDSIAKLAPAGKSCDEYPMASTWNGAMSAPNDSYWRTQAGCQMGSKRQIGYTGWSRCFINAQDNEKGGFVELARFLSNARSLGGQRILDWDPYFVNTP
ncbi:hypothetical protein [Actinoplanes sp. NPDC049681]|uniref:hypothetical protein n=1 Tax=Actinoplanes sp. NPDC049681 TaxID=3363905 RepID=UPI0037B54FC8